MYTATSWPTRICSISVSRKLAITHHSVFCTSENSVSPTFTKAPTLVLRLVTHPSTLARTSQYCRFSLASSTSTFAAATRTFMSPSCASALRACFCSASALTTADCVATTVASAFTTPASAAATVALAACTSLSASATRSAVMNCCSSSGFTRDR